MDFKISKQTPLYSFSSPFTISNEIKLKLSYSDINLTSTLPSIPFFVKNLNEKPPSYQKENVNKFEKMLNNLNGINI